MSRRSPISSSAPIDRAMPLFARIPAVRRAILSRTQDSRLRRQLLLAGLRWGYGRFNESGALPEPVLDPSMEFEQTAMLIDTAGTFSGIEGFEAMVSELRDAFGEIRFEPDSVIWLSRDEVLVTVQFRAMGSGSGIGTERQLAHWLKFRDGRIVRFSVFWERSDALEAAGLSE
jgi:ketosteroid isomerase-like protein